MFHCNPCTTNYAPADRCPHCQANDYHEPNDGSEASRGCPHCDLTDDEDDEEDDMAKLSKLGGLTDATDAVDAPPDTGEVAPEQEPAPTEEAEEVTAGASGGAHNASIVATDGPPVRPTNNRKAAWAAYVSALYAWLDLEPPAGLDTKPASALKALAATLEDELPEGGG